VLERNGWEIRIKFFDGKCKYHIIEGVGVGIGFWAGVPDNVCVNFGMSPYSNRFEITILAP